MLCSGDAPKADYSVLASSKPRLTLGSCPSLRRRWQDAGWLAIRGKKISISSITGRVFLTTLGTELQKTQCTVVPTATFALFGAPPYFHDKIDAIEYPIQLLNHHVCNMPEDRYLLRL